MWVLQKITSGVNVLRKGATAMNLRDYIHRLDQDALAAYSSRCGIAVSYMRLHVKYASKDPSVSLIRALYRESEGFVSLAEVLEHFGIVETSSVRISA